VNRKLASYCKQEILIFELGKLFSPTSGLVVKTAKCKRGITFKQILIYSLVGTIWICWFYFNFERCVGNCKYD